VRLGPPGRPGRAAGRGPAGGRRVRVRGGALLARRRADVEPAQGSDGTDGQWRIARKVARSGGLHGDLDARVVHRSRSVKIHGKARVVVAPDAGLVTACQLTLTRQAERR
jgi:hypothetical protein